MSETPVLIVGLGNPGPKYVGTRHNVGFEVIDELLTRVSPMPASLSVHKKTNTEIVELPAGRLLGRRAIVAKPRCFMNLSGGAVKALTSYYGIEPGDVVVIYDDLELEFGQVKLRSGGGDHGHNGLRSITKSLGTKDYQRLGVGIGRPPGRQDVASFVLKPFAKSEVADLPIVAADAADLLEQSLR